MDAATEVTERLKELCSRHSETRKAVNLLTDLFERRFETRTTAKPPAALLLGTSTREMEKVAETLADRMGRPLIRCYCGQYGPQVFTYAMVGVAPVYVGGPGFLTSAVKAQPNAIVVFDDFQAVTGSSDVWTVVDEILCGSLIDRRSGEEVDASGVVVLFAVEVGEAAEEIATRSRVDPTEVNTCGNEALRYLYRHIVSAKGDFPIDYMDAVCDLVPR